MLILAGVSINAIVGDNGIITNAQTANVKSGMAALEEFLQGKYVENFENFNNEEIKVVQLQNLYPAYFYIPANEGIGGLRYVVDSNGYALYLIKKSGLPDKIKEQLVGGNAGDGSYTSYISLNDVYGVTADLKVYYCESGINSILGLTSDALNVDNPSRTVYGYENRFSYALKSFDSDGDGTISANEVKSVKEVTIDSTSGVTSLLEMYNLSSLEKLTLKDLTLNNLDGIQNCSKLYYILLDNCIVTDYSSLGGLGSRLNYLYITNTNDEEMVKMCSGLSNAELNKLDYLAISGNINYIGSTEIIKFGDYVEVNTKATKVITTTSFFNLLSPTIKKTVKYLSINNNQITSLSGVGVFSSLLFLRADKNNLTDLSGIENLINLEWVTVIYNDLTSLCTFAQGSKLETLACAKNSNLTSLSNMSNCTMLKNLYASGCKLGYNLEVSTEKKTTDSLKTLSNISTIKIVWLDNNSNLIWLDYLSSSLNTITSMKLSGNTNIADSAITAMKIAIIKGCNDYPSNYSLLLLDSNTTILDLNGQTITASKLSQLNIYTNLTHLNLTSITITDIPQGSNINSILNTLLESFSKMKYLKLFGINELTSIGFVSSMKFLVELDIGDTGVTDLSALETMTVNSISAYNSLPKNADGTVSIPSDSNANFRLNTLRIDNLSVNLGLIPQTISRMDQDCYWNLRQNTVNGGLLKVSLKQLKTLEKNTTLSLIRLGDNWQKEGELDLSGCTNLKKYYSYIPAATTTKLPSRNKNCILLGWCFNVRFC